MEEGKSRRQRAVRLTDQARQLLQDRLLGEWRRVSPDRLTWQVRANLLHVSVGTAKRILNRSGNDKVVLEQAFAALGLEWNDEYCEPVSGPEEAASTEPIVEPTEVIRSGRATTQLRRPWLIPATLGGVALAVSVLIGILAFQSRKPPPYDQLPQVRELAVARAAYHRADYKSALRIVKNAYRLAYDVIDPNTMSEAIRVEGDILAAQGDLEGAIERYETALAFRTEFNQIWARSSLLIALAIVEQRLGRHDDAQSHLEEAYNGMLIAKDTGGLAEAARELGSLAARKGDIAGARKWFDTASDAIKDRPDEAMHTDIRARRAMLLSLEGDHAAALDVLDECLQIWTQRGHPRWRATTLRQIATVQWNAGQREPARASVQKALSEYAYVGDRQGVRECQEWLASNAPPVSRRTVAP